MIKFIQRLRKGYLCKDSVAAFSPTCLCEKALVGQGTSKQCLTEKDADETKIREFSQVGFASFNFKDEPVHPEEPSEIDHPMRCPHPEPCIIQDGRALKERIPSVKRRGQLPFLSKSEVQRLGWSCHSAPSHFRSYPEAPAGDPCLSHALASTNYTMLPTEM